MHAFIWIVAVYLAIGLLVGALIAFMASGQGDPITFLQFTKEVAIWPYRAWLTFRVN